MANNINNTARQLEPVYEGNKLTIKRYVSKLAQAKAQERKCNVVVLKLASLILSVGILSGIYVYSRAGIYSTQARIDDLQEELLLNESNYTQSLTAFNNKFTQEFVVSYATENLGFSESSSSIIYIQTDSDTVEIYK